MLDLDYAEDFSCRRRRQLRHDGLGRHRRGAGHGGDGAFTQEGFDQLMALAKKGIAELVALQKLTVA